MILERIRAAGVEARDEARTALKTATPAALADNEQPLQQLAASSFMAYHASRLYGAYVELAIDYWRLKQKDPDTAALRADALKKMDQVATEWTIMGKIGLGPDYAEEKWRKVAANIKKDLGLSYAGPKAENVIVEPDLPKRAGRSMKSESTETTD